MRPAVAAPVVVCRSAIRHGFSKNPSFQPSHQRWCLISPADQGPRSGPPAEPEGHAMLKTLMLAAALGLAGTAAMAQTATQPSTTTPTRSGADRPATTAPAATPAPAATTRPPSSSTSTRRPRPSCVSPRIGEARAKAIIAGRPYRGKDELVRKNILTQGVYDGIQARSSPASAKFSALCSPSPPRRGGFLLGRRFPRPHPHPPLWRGEGDFGVPPIGAAGPGATVTDPAQRGSPPPLGRGEGKGGAFLP